MKLGEYLSDEILFLAKLEVLNKDVLELKSLPIVFEFPNVFSEECNSCQQSEK